MRRLILSLLTVSGLLAQTIHISGNYLDLLDNPIDSVNVYYYQDFVVVDSTLTSSSGAFDLQITIVSTDPTLPSRFQLSQNYPNPLNPSTRIDLSIQEPGSFSIYDIRGALVESIELPSSGSYELTWGGRNLGAGLYIYVLRSGSQSSSRKMILLDGGDGSGLAASQVSCGTLGLLAKPASNDAIKFEKVNTTPLELDFFTPQSDTSLGVINGNVGPVHIQIIPDTAFVAGEPWGLDWNAYFYNDSETMFIEAIFMPPDSGDTHYLIQAWDLMDSTLTSESNIFSVSEIHVNDPPEFQTNDSDTSIYLDETLALALNCIDVDDSLLTYTLNQPDCIWIISDDSLFITPPDTGYYDLSIVASDPSGLTDTLSVELYVHPWDSWQHITGTIRDIYSLEGMAGLTVQLLDSATIIQDFYTPFGFKDITEQIPELVNILGETITDAGGNYLFPNMMPGKYVANVFPADTSIYFAKKGMIIEVSERLGVADSLAEGNQYTMIPKDLQVPGTIGETIRINLLQLYQGRFPPGYLDNLFLNYQGNIKTNAHEMAGRPMPVYLGNFTAQDSAQFLQYLAEGDSLFGKVGTIILGRQTPYPNDMTGAEKRTFHPTENTFADRAGWNIYSSNENQTYPALANRPNIYFIIGGDINITGQGGTGVGMGRPPALKETQARPRGWGDVPAASRQSLMNLTPGETTTMDRGLEGVHSLFAIRIIEGYETGHRTDYRNE